MRYVKLIGWLMFIWGITTAFAGCSHRPVYEKMNATYIVHLDMRHEDKKPMRTTQYKPEDVRDANMDLVDQLVNKEIQTQLKYDELTNE